MNIKLNPELERIVNDELKSGQFRSAEDVIARALADFHERTQACANGGQEKAVRDMLEFAEKNRTPLNGVSIKDLIHEGHRL